jgi:hypothetical protein
MPQEQQAQALQCPDGYKGEVFSTVNGIPVTLCPHERPHLCMWEFFTAKAGTASRYVQVYSFVIQCVCMYANENSVGSKYSVSYNVDIFV